jgi:hypothetical protein
VVGCKSVPSKLLMHDHNSDTNCGPLSEVMCNGTPNLATQFWMYALAIVYVSVSRMGTASSQRVKRSAAVRRYELPCDSGRGPTKSMWTCSKRVNAKRTWKTPVSSSFLLLGGTANGRCRKLFCAKFPAPQVLLFLSTRHTEG